jgi:hypothetical protein
VTSDLLSEAVAELYAADPDAFTERRGVLAAQARAAGEAPVAKSIAGLRKPTRSAWVVNQLVRADPSVASRLAALGDELRAAERSLEGAKIRELSRARRELIDTLVRQALVTAAQSSPPAALREEVTATFGAALADPQVAEQLAAGTLVRAERRAGFGSGGAPALSLVPSPQRRRPAPAATAPAAPAPAGTAAAPPARPAAEAAKAAKAAAAAEARERAERERRRAIAEAEQAVADAGQAADAAARAERTQESAVRLIEEQLAEARQRLSELKVEARRTNSARRKARQALDRLPR